MSERKSNYRYQLYMKRAILEAHAAALSKTINEIEVGATSESYSKDDFRMNEDKCFSKYLKIIKGIE